MPLGSYAELQTSVADWLARPGDPLLTPAIPDMIVLFEELARDRLRTRFVEKNIVITPPANTDTIPLPLDYGELRTMWIDTANGRRHFTYQTPVNMDTNLLFLDGYPVAYTIEGLNLRITGNTGDAPDPIHLDYLSGLTALSDAAPTNWLLTQYPSTYLWGTLSMAAPYIGDDQRMPVWLGMREERIEDIKLADRRAKYPAGLVIQTDVRNP
jgi:hypothetical protein